MPSTYTVSWSETALEALATLPERAQAQIKKKAAMLASNPHPSTSKKLKGQDDTEAAIYRARSGDYRILYTVEGPPVLIVLVVTVGDRKDVYRSMDD